MTGLVNAQLEIYRQVVAQTGPVPGEPPKGNWFKEPTSEPKKTDKPSMPPDLLKKAVETLKAFFHTKVMNRETLTNEAIAQKMYEFFTAENNGGFSDDRITVLEAELAERDRLLTKANEMLDRANDLLRRNNRALLRVTGQCR